MTATRRIANPIAVRRYAVVGEPGREVVLTIGKPRPDPRPGGDWVCSVLIEGIPNERRRHSHGVDAIGALQDAMILARHALDASRLPLTWLDGEPGALDLPLSVPTAWGLKLQRRLERYLKREVRKVALAATAAGKARERRRSNPGS
jgi:hypothetical protein